MSRSTAVWDLKKITAGVLQKEKERERDEQYENAFENNKEKKREGQKRGERRKQAKQKNTRQTYTNDVPVHALGLYRSILTR